ADRLRLAADNRARLTEALEAALRHGNGHVLVYPLDEQRRAGKARRFSAGLHCPDCDKQFSTPVPSLFSFNSPLGACPECRGFGRTMGIDPNLVVPDQNLSLAGGAVKPFQTERNRRHQTRLVSFAKKKNIPVDKPWRELNDQQRDWVMQGDGGPRSGKWYGVNRFFARLERKSYRMHVRVLLAKYRSYDVCETCHGARLVPAALDWRIGDRALADAALAGQPRHRHDGMSMSERSHARLPGLALHDLVCLPLDRCQAFFEQWSPPAPLDEAIEQLLESIRSRLRFLNEVGLGYLTLDRQSRTLSGGEVQRINLTTALGTSLVNTLFVLDEPSIGMHPRDMQRIVSVLHKLRDAGNTLLIVEHDPQVMLAADRIIDIGPGPGPQGGNIVFDGTVRQMLRSKRSLTARYLRGDLTAAGEPRPLPPPGADDRWLSVRGARANNLRDIDVDIPLDRMVCVTGVSGSGKSTLVQDVLYNAVAKIKGAHKDIPGAHDEITGHQHFDDIVMVDQSPIGKTTRSNPASYVGAFDAIRKAFVRQPLARERDYKPGTFSFNTGTGRCPVCSGNGFEHIEMQFLSDVYIRCAECNGRRYRDEVLEIRLPGYDRDDQLRGLSIADVLELSVTDAMHFFADYADVRQALKPLVAVGLGYVQLGQPVPTLSGGEAQRLKLAGHLVQARKRGGGRTLFIFDEPTTGLHFEDISVLLEAFRQLRDHGNSLVIIEHNLDVIGAADWVIDLGPEGGAAGGQLVTTGTPTQVAKVNHSHTGVALAAYLEEPVPALPSPRKRKTNGNAAIEIHNAREHNLDEVDVTIPRDRFTVITGVSGSGKSTVAFDILFAEGQRRYLESLNAYARQFVQPAARPDVDAISGIPPTVAIEQRTSRGGRKSTVATMTELYHFIRLLFVRLGVQHCPDCDIEIAPQSTDEIAAQLLRRYRGKEITLLAPLVVARKGYYTDLAKWAAKKGFAELRVDGEMLPTDNWPRLDRFSEHDIELPVATLKPSSRNEAALRQALEQTLQFGNGLVHVAAGARTQVYSTQRACPGCARSFPEPDPRLFSFNSRHGWCPDCFGTGLELEDFSEEATGEEPWWRHSDDSVTCQGCDGRRLRPEALSIYFHDHDIAALSSMSVGEAAGFFESLRLRGREAEIARDVVAELRSRLQFLEQVGLAYLSLDRAAPTLSGGEAQRIRLAAQLGSNLRGVCYILDEPTIGLHARDNDMLLDTLGQLEQRGNTVIVVEHDEDTIRRAEHVIDLGPGAGVRGGEVVANGSLDDLLRSKRSLTAKMLREPLAHPLNGQRRSTRKAPKLVIRDASLHNLRMIDIPIPLQRLVCVTGVSGSGKSTAIRDILHDNLEQLLAQKRRRRSTELHGCREIEGWQQVGRLLEVDQTPIGKTPRSCPATYVGFWDDIRKLFAQTPEARMRGWGPGRFSFNVAGGRCDACDGQGARRIEMSFLPDVKVPCEVCRGSRFNTETCMATYRDR
ncbi:MAG: excinuclease ABC subunit UvrA, partial [Gammaproteobacteria bacterium]|nr:excinuclease ABC subunit UvrA [Gammaproteobacteria bacterium]